MPAGRLNKVRDAKGYIRRKPKMGKYKTSYSQRKQGLFKNKPVSGGTLLVPRPQVQRGFLPFSPSMMTRLPWSHSVPVNAPGSSVSGVVTYRLNGARDPDYSVGAGQNSPQQWNQIKGLYAKYLVYAAKVSLEYTNPNAGGLYVGYGLRFTGDSGGYDGLSLDALTMKRNVKLLPLSTTGSRTVKMEQYIKLADVFGITKDAYADADDLFGSLTTSGDPTREAWITPIILDSAAGTAGCHLRIGITYYTKFYEPLWQAPSS